MLEMTKQTAYQLVYFFERFLTLFCNCLPQPTVLRVWDLIFLEGNEVLLRTALAIWQVLAVRILTVRTADEFYCLMGVLTREILEFDLVDANSLIKAVVAIGPLTELPTLREHYLYNINPWGSAITQAVDKQVKLYTRQSIALDIGALKKQYTKLKQRQRQAHIIFSAAITRQPPPSPPVTMNHLLLGKSALVPAKRLGPPPGSIPPPPKPPSTLHWRDAPKQQSSSSSSSDTELCDEESDHNSDVEDKGDTQFIDDNPQQVSDIIVTNDNTTTSADISGTVEVDNHSLMTDSLTNIKSESDDESVDFEQFLIDRVKCMRDFDEESAAEEKINFARRNSQKALQIIQENSLILQRIMQCQSRLSPPFNIQDQERETVDLDESMHSPLTLLSPNIIPVRPQLTPLHIPVLDSGEAIHSWDTNFFSNTDEASSKDDFQTECPISPTPLKVGTMYPKTLLTDEIDNKILEKGEKSSSNSLNQSEITRSTQLKIAISPAIEQDVISPAYGSRYTNILEKSKSLDERYNALILGKQPYDLPRTDEVDGLQTSYSWSISSPSEPRFTDQQDISPTNNTSTVTHNDILNEESVKLNVERGFIGDDTDVVGKIEPLNTDPLSSIKNIEDQKLSAQVAEISPTENDIRYLDNRSVTVNRFDSKFEDFFNQIAVTKGNSNSSQTLHDKYDTLDSFDFTYSRYTQKDAPEFTELDQFSPLDSKEYKLATPEFERFYTITRDNATKDMSPLECGNNINIEGSILHPGLSGEKNIPYSNCSPKHSPAPSTSSFKSHSKENEDTKSSYEDINNLEITISGDFSSNSFSSSSKTCYSYISSKSDSAYSTADSTRTESIISGNVDQIASKRTTLKLDLSSPGTLVSPLISPLKPLKSPSRSPLKSPSRGFNPFPVQNNSRQNKEVLLKLGLYKK